MKNNLKISLLSFIACVLTVGGVFGAWVFGEGDNSASVETNTTVGTLPSDYWYFDKTTVTFDCVQSYKIDTDGNGVQETYTGRFNTFDGLRVESFSTGINQCIDYNLYQTTIAALGTPKLFKEDGTELTSYAFSHWVYYDEEDETHFFNFDVAISSSMTLYAQYVPTTNPAIYEVDGETNALVNLIGYMFVNPSDNSEYIKNNFIVDKDPMNLCPQDGDESSYRNPVYGIRYNNTTYKCVDDGGVDRVYRGSYTVYFKPGTVSNTDWDHFGGHAFFQRQYKFALIGNPIKSWAYSQENAITLGYVQTNSSDSDSSNITYKASKVRLTEELWDHDGNANTEDEPYFGFKPYEPYFHLNFHTPKDSSYTDVKLLCGDRVVYSDGTQTAKSTIDDNIYPVNKKDCLYDVTAVVQFDKVEDYGGYVIYNLYPTSITVSITPCEYTVTYYDEDGTNVEYEEAVAYGETLEAFKSNDLNHIVTSGSNIKLVVSWVDIYTNQTFTAEELLTREITGNLHLKPVYGETISPHTTYNYYNGHTASAWTAGITKYLYDTNGVYESLESFTLDESEFVEGEHDQNYAADSTVWYSSFDQSGIDNPLGVDDINTGDISSSGIINYYIKLSRSDDTVHLPNVDITDTNDQVIYQDVVEANNTYSFGTTTYVLDNNLEEKQIAAPNINTISTEGLYMFRIKNKVVVGTPTLVDCTGYTNSTFNDKYIYLNPTKAFDGGNGWFTSNATFFAHFWNTTNDKDVKMTKLSDGTYYCEKPSNNSNPGAGSVIFVRMPSGSTSLNWDNKWNQTGDLVYTGNGNNIFNITSWGGGNWGKREWHFSTSTINNDITTNESLKTICLKPTSIWNDDGAWFAAYFFDASGNYNWRKMYELETGSGVFVCDVPTDNTYTNVIFVRMNPEFTVPSWDYYQDNTEKNVVWNQTIDLELTTSTTYTIENGPDSDNKYSGTWS